jgi:hypothetical protein
MAIFGGLGKALGLGSTGQVAQSVAGALGFSPQLSRTIGGAAQSVSEFVSVDDKDVSPPPAGVDSPATVTNISQTSQLPGGLAGVPSRAFREGQMLPNQALIGGFGIPGLIGQAGRLLSRPGVGGALTGVGAGLGFDVITDMFGNQKKLVITRKLQRDVKKVFMMSGGDIGFVAANSMMLFGKSLSEDQILMIMFKTFKNQGPYVTKAAVRKTRQTIRKMETLCDLKDRLTPPKPARRRPAARRMSTSITQVK